MESEFAKLGFVSERERENSGSAVQMGSGCGGEDCTVLCIDEDDRLVWLL